MRIEVVGGGPGGLYFAILAKKALPDLRITVYERNRPDDTYGWGVVFSDETLAGFGDADPESFERITASFVRWEDIETFYAGTRTVSTGHGFSALSRRRLLEILQDRAREVGVGLSFEEEVAGLERFAGADLIVAADGINSAIRRAHLEAFRPKVDWRRCRFTWLGTTKPLDAFTFIFEPTEHGLFQVHAYPFGEGLATWIVECRDEVWRRASLDRASEAETVAFCEKLFAPWLDGHRLLSNRSIWRRFPTVQCETWHLLDGAPAPLVLLGDAAHTAHFSIGSGTKMAMEDAIALAGALAAALEGDEPSPVPAALAAYEADRWVEVAKAQKAAQTSLEWFESSARYMGQHPLQLTFNLMTRSKRITYDNLAERDPELVARVAEQYREEELGAEAVPPPGEPVPPPMFTPLRLRGLTLANRIVVSPMCQYSAQDGAPDDWHLVHLGTRAIGGAGLLITEMTDVSPEGRITHGCTGMYREEHAAAWRRIVDFVHEHSHAKIALQLAHAGRKGSAYHPWEGDDLPLRPEEGAWPTCGPSPLPFRPGWPAPKEMDRADMDRVIADFVRAARWGEEAGFDMLELHMAHGYLLSSFISSLSNRRRDGYGGAIENRMRYPLEVFRAMRQAWPEAKPMSVRITASDWMADGSGVTGDEAVAVSRLLAEAGCDVVDVSSGGNVPESDPLYGRMYQVPFAEQIRYEAGVPVMAVGAIQGADHANTVLAAGRADLVAMARPHLHDPYLTLHAAERYGVWRQEWPGQYDPARPRPPRPERRRRVRALSPTARPVPEESDTLTKVTAPDGIEEDR
jgi:anthraniloyl-CoA monooxygenase